MASPNVRINLDRLAEPMHREFLASTGFLVYLVLVWHIWRTPTPHHLRLHQLYGRGYLVCALSRAEIAAHLGVSMATISTAIAGLTKQNLVGVDRTGRASVYLLGTLQMADDGQITESLYLDEPDEVRGEALRADMERIKADELVPATTTAFTPLTPSITMPEEPQTQQSEQGRRRKRATGVVQGEGPALVMKPMPLFDLDAIPSTGLGDGNVPTEWDIKNPTTVEGGDQ